MTFTFIGKTIKMTLTMLTSCRRTRWLILYIYCTTRQDVMTIINIRKINWIIIYIKCMNTTFKTKTNSIITIELSNKNIRILVPYESRWFVGVADFRQLDIQQLEIVRGSVDEISVIRFISANYLKSYVNLSNREERTFKEASWRNDF